MSAMASYLLRHARSVISVVLILMCSAAAYGSDTYDGTNLTIPTLTIGNAIYTNVVVAVSINDIVSGPSGSTANGGPDSYDPANNQLSLQSVTVGVNTYYNVVVTVGKLVSIENVTGADTYDGAKLDIAAVQVIGGS